MTNRKMRVLCLHGKRTSGNIMKMQTSAMRYHTPMDCDFIDAPFLAEGKIYTSVIYKTDF